MSGSPVFVEFINDGNGEPMPIQVSDISAFQRYDRYSNSGNATSIKLKDGTWLLVAGGYDDTKSRLQKAGATFL